MPFNALSIEPKPIRHVRYNQEFRRAEITGDREIYSLTMRDTFLKDGVVYVEARDRHGRKVLLDWNEVVTPTAG